MRNDQTIHELALRATWLNKASLWAAGCAALCALIAALLIEPGAGAAMRDVHVPYALKDALTAHRELLAAGEPQPVGRAIGALPRWLSAFIEITAQASPITIIWALATRRKHLVVPCVIYIAVVNLMGPVPLALQPAPPVSIGVESARKIFAREYSSCAQEECESALKYVRAQIAYASNDLSQSARLVEGMNASVFKSPIEGAYRLQFLKGRYAGVTTTCFKSGCLQEGARASLMSFFLIALAGCATAAAIFGALQREISSRVQRILQLTAGSALAKAP